MTIVRQDPVQHRHHQEGKTVQSLDAQNGPSLVALLGALAHPVALLTSASPVGTSDLIAGMIDAVTVVVGAVSKSVLLAMVAGVIAVVIARAL